MFTFDVFQRFRRVKPTATVFRAGTRIHRAQQFATAAFFPVHIKTISASGPTNARSTRPILFPYAGTLPIIPVYGTQRIGVAYVVIARRTGRIRRPVRALFLPNFRFAGISSRLGTTYPFFFLRRFTGFFGAFPGMVVFRGRPRLGFGCNISLTMFGTVSDFPALHQKNVAVPVL